MVEPGLEPRSPYHSLTCVFNTASSEAVVHLIGEGSIFSSPSQLSQTLFGLLDVQCLTVKETSHLKTKPPCTDKENY